LSGEAKGRISIFEPILFFSGATRVVHVIRTPLAAPLKNSRFRGVPLL
jgi:hypothetical protein